MKRNIMEIDRNNYCFSEDWNMKGNTKVFLMAEKSYRDTYANILRGLNPLIKEDDENDSFFMENANYRLASWLTQEIKDEEQFRMLVDKAKHVIAAVNRIVPQRQTMENKILNRLSNTVPQKNVMSLVCFHSAINNVCEFVHLHRKPENYRAAAMLVGVANKKLGLGAIHYIRILITLINLAKEDWIKVGAIEVAKLIGKNVLGCYPVEACGIVIEEGIGLAELAYENSTSVNAYALEPVELEINRDVKLPARFELPLHMGGYLAYCKKCDMHILGFRGTTSWKNWVTNISQYLVGVSLIYMLALGLAVKMKEKYGDRLLVVGHSLGGGLTQFAVAGLNDYHVKGLGYNSAGLSNMADDMMKDKFQWNIYHLHLCNDQVFYIGNQLGRCYDQNGLVGNPKKAHKLVFMRKIASRTASPSCFRLG